MPVYPQLYTEIHDGDDATANSINSRLSEISNAVGQLGDGTDPLASPDITSFINSVHLHTNDASGGQMPFDDLDTSGATAGQKWIADGAGGGSWTTGFPFLAAITQAARISDISNEWLRCDGRTIGNATSGGTARANADMHDLFVHLWSESTNAELIIQDSSGSPTTRLGTAELDWDDDKRLPLPDARGRVIGMMDDPTGADPANIVTDAAADVLFGVMGEEAHTLTEAELAAHNHTGSMATAGGAGIYPISGNSTPTGTYTLNNTGSGSAHNNMQPILFLNYFIYTGN